MGIVLLLECMAIDIDETLQLIVEPYNTFFILLFATLRRTPSQTKTYLVYFNRRISAQYLRPWEDEDLFSLFLTRVNFKSHFTKKGKRNGYFYFKANEYPY